jgi:hypothetical protein
MTMTFLMLLLLPVFASHGPASVAGSWTLSTNVQGNTGSPTCTFKEDAGKITGTCSAPNNTQSEVSGEVTDTKVTFRYNIEWEGNPLTLVFTGTLDSDTTMKGTMEVQPMGVPGEFTAKKG